MRPSFHVLLLAALSCAPLRAQAGEAVVLSGGGSLGIAHAGALIGIEQRGHDPDLVLGTSMGAIVGAFYAAGYAPDSIAAILEHEDWRGLFAPLPMPCGPTRALRYPAVHLRRGGGGWVLRGFISDWRINRELVLRLFPASARARGDFDRLPRRYRSVAADLETGGLVPIQSGDLARAVRASMASPGIFAPIRWGGRILVDGGVNDYMPVDEARRLGAGFVIGVDVLKPPSRISSLDALMVADRTFRLTIERARSGGAQPDVLVRPKDPGLTGFTFPIDPTPLVNAGLLAALRDVDPASEERSSAARESAPEPASLGRLDVDAPSSPLGPFVRRAFQDASKAPYRPERLFERMDRLYATGLFDGVWPSVEDTSSSITPDWIVRAETDSRLSAAGALGFDNDRGGRIWGSLQGIGRGSSTPIQLGLEGSANGIEHSGSLLLRVPTLGDPPTAWSAGGTVSEAEIPFLAADLGENPEVRRAGGWMGAEWLRIASALEGAAVFRAERIRSDAGPDGDSFGPFVRLGGVPPLVEVVGTAPSVEGEARFGDVRYRRARIKGSVGRSVGSLALALLGDAEAAGGDVPLDVAPAMGTDLLVPALRWGERRGKARAIGGLDLAYSLPLQGTVRLRLRGGVIADETRADGSFGRESSWLGGAGLSGLWWTPYGRVEAGFEAGTLGDRRLIVRLGQDF